MSLDSPQPPLAVRAKMEAHVRALAELALAAHMSPVDFAVWFSLQLAGMTNFIIQETTDTESDQVN